MQVGKFLKNIKRAGQNRSAGGKFSGKSINVQIKIKPSRGEFFLKINKRADQNKTMQGGIFFSKALPTLPMEKIEKIRSIPK